MCVYSKDIHRNTQFSQEIEKNVKISYKPLTQKESSGLKTQKLSSR